MIGWLVQRFKIYAPGPTIPHKSGTDGAKQWKRKVPRRSMPGSKSKLLLLLLNLTILISDHSVSGWIAGSSNAAAYWNGGSKEAKPVVVINRRHVPTDPDKLEAYNKAHKAASDYMMKHIKGTKAAFQSTDAKNSSLVHDVQWWDSLQGFLDHTDKKNEKMMEALNNWIPKYDMSIPFKGHVFGGWNEDVKRITVEVGQADFMMVPRGAGFIKQTGDGVEGPPVIVYNHRRVLPGKMEALLKAQQEFADLMYKTVPGVVAITSGVDDDDPNLLHDLQVFANFDVFVGHADVENPAVADKFWKWIDFEKYDKSEAFYGQVWAPKANIEMVKRMTTELGGAKFDVYPIEDIQGSVDMNNWD